MKKLIMISTASGKLPLDTKAQLQAYKGEWERERSEQGEDLANIEDRLLWEMEIHTGALRRAMKRERAGEKVDLWQYRKDFWLAYHRLTDYMRRS